MAYQHTIKKRNNKKERAVTRQLEPRVVLASLAMAAGIFAYPFGVEATEIIRKDGTAITTETNVYNIDPEKVSGDFAYNRFSAFILDAGHIANMQFGGADVLANLVNSRIDINGTINAIKNNAIDGHLMFLSPDGIAVGASGVINAGQFTGIVPTRTAFDTLYNAANITLDNITGLNSYAIKDKDGKAVGIDVSGQINTHSGVMLGAGIININDGAKIQSTKDLNFTDLVNIQGGASAGLTGDLTASAESGGDIILTAKQTSDVKDTKTENNAQVPNAIRWRDRSTDFNAAVNIGENVAITNKDGAVKLTAESTSTYEDSTPMTLTGTVMKDLILGDDKTLLDGVVNKLAGQEASANKYLFVNYSNKKNKASVNIGENSNITGNNIDVSATSTVEIKQSVAVPSSGKDSEGKTVENTSAMPVAAVAISRVYNNADVVIDGNLTATGADEKGSGINIAANADTTAALSATAAGGEKTSAAVGVAVLSGDTKAKVTVNEGATALTATQGKVSVGAATSSDIDVNVNAVGTNSYVVSNVGVANYDSSADVTVNRSITAGAVDVKAENAISKLKMTVDNTENSGGGGKETERPTDDEKQQDNTDATKEKNKGDAGKSEDEKKSEKKSVDPTKVVKDANVDTTDAKTNDATGSDGKGGVQDVKDKVEGTNNGGDNGTKTSVFGLGAAVGVVSNTNDANVTIGKNAAITATKPADAAEGVDGSVKVAADSLMSGKDGFAFSVKNALANDKVGIGAAVLVSGVKNNAAVLMDSDGTNAAQIVGGGAVSLNASAGMGKYKEKDANGQETGDEKDTTLTYAASAENKSEEDADATFALDGSVGVNTLKNNAVVLLGQKSKVEGTEVKLSSDTTAKAEGTYGAEDAETKFGVGATVGLQNIRNNSLVMAGKGAELKGSTSLEASAENSLDAKNSVKNAGKGDSFGISGMVALSYGDSNSIVSIDDEAVINAPEVSVDSTNSTSVDNSARSNAEGTTGSKSFGLGVGVVNYDVNSVAMIADNGSGITAPSGSSTDVEKAAQKIYNDAKLAQSVAGTALAGKLGTKTANGTKGAVTTADLSVSATTTGMLQNDAKANFSSKDAESGDDKTEKWTNWSKQGSDGANEAKQNTQKLENDTQESQNESAAPTVGSNNASGAAGEASQAADPDGSPAAPPAVSGSAGASIGVEGSVALTFLGGRTDAVLDNVTVSNGDDGVSSVDLSATDFLGSITLGGTKTKNSLKDGSATKVGVGGTFAMNSSTRNVDSLLRSSKIESVSYLANEASKIGLEVAAGMSTSSNSGSGTNVSGAGVVYYNKAVQDVHALMIDNDVTSTSLFTLLSNEATSTDFQIAGGLAFNSASSDDGKNVGVGGAVAVSQLENNLASGVVGGKYTDFTTVKVEAEKGTTQINGALAGAKSDYGFNGAFAYGSVKNSVHAYIDKAETKDTLALGEVRVRAGEVSIDLAAETEADKTLIANVNKLKAQAKANKLKKLQDAKDKEKTETANNKKTLEDAGFDPTGKIYLDTEETQSSIKGDGVENTDASEAASDAASDEKSAKSLLDGNYSRTITAAMAGGWGSEAGAGAGIAYNYVKNDIAADITNSTLATYEVKGEAASDSLIVSVGAGVAVGGKAFNGAGSGSWNDLKNDTKVNIANNTITGSTLLQNVGVDGVMGGKLTAKAENTSSIFNIAGEVAGGKGMALGLSLAYNSLNNTTGSYLTGNTVRMPDIVGTGDSFVNVTSLNKSNALAVAGGVDVSIDQSFAGAVGTVAINRGVSNTESVVDGKTSGENTTLDNLNSLVVAAEDVTKKTTVAGGVSVGGSKVGVGGSVAYTSVGSSKNKEKLRAEINNADVTTTEAGVISVSVTDSKKKENSDELEKSRITTVGAGIGVGWGKNWFGLQGAAAVSDIYKDSQASLNNTNINATEENKNNHPMIDVTADTKSKINTVGAVGNISITGKVTGTAGVAINRINQDTKAEMATDDGKTTTVNAGRTRVRATGDADIHSVGVGGTVSVGEYVAIAGSGSYNYIDNDVDAIIKNQNLTSNNNVGVVAQSDDRLYNFAGGFNIGANTRAALGAAVGINKITGSTNALVSGGSVAASGSTDASDAITVTRPQDENLFTTEKLDLTTDRTRLAESRTTENKTGIVVDSSATHTLISQMSSGGVAASASVGVNLAGTVNLNTVDGSTTAKIKDAALNTENIVSNINVNAVDYTNIGSFTGTPSVGVGATAGVSVGVSADWETLNRTTAAEISSASDKKKAYAKDLTVDATAKHGSSTLSFAAAAGAAATAGVASGDSIMRHKNTSATTALMKNMDAEFDGAANIRATHLGNSYAQNIAVTAAGGYAAVGIGAGVAVMDDASTVKAEVSGSDLKAKSKESGKDISVLADNENNWKETLVTASLAVGLGGALAANVGIHNTTGETSALVTNSQLEAHDVNVKATDKLTAKSIGGVGAGGLAGAGVAVALNNINSSTNAHVTGGSVAASNDVNVQAEETRSFDGSVTGAAAGGVGIGVNVAVTSINKGITDAQLSNAKDENNNSTGVNNTTQSEISKHLSSVNGAKGALGVSGAKLAGLKSTDSDLSAARNTTVSLSTPKTNTQGVHTSVSGASLTAAEKVNVTAKDTSDISAKNVGVSAGLGASVNVSDIIIHTNYDTDVTVNNNANVTGKNVNIEALQTQEGDGSKINVTAVAAGAGLGVGVGYAGIVNKGATDVNIANSSITATGSGETDKGLTVSAKDESKHKTDITNVGVSALNVTTTFASVENNTNVGVTLGGTNNIAAAKDAVIDATKANALEAHTQGVGVGGVAVAVNHATIEDEGNASAKITGTTNITGADANSAAEKFHLGATNDTTAKLSAGNTAVSVLGISTMRGKGVMDMGAEVSVAGGSFNAKTVEFASSLGTANGRTLEGNVKGHNISVGAVAPDTVRLETTATGKVDVANSTFGENTDLILDNESYVDRKAYIYDVTAGGVAVGNSRAIISGVETLTTTLTGKSGTTNKLNSLQAFAYGENVGKAFADAGGGGLVGYIGSHVDNKSTNTVTSTLGGKWDVAGDVYLIAAQKDETRLTAKEGHGGVIGVGGTSVENTINTTANAAVANGTEITSNRVHVGTLNAVTAGAYDDVDGKGNKDVQTYTLQDHFGGAISGNRLRSLLDITENGTVTIGDNAKITTNKLQEYIAASQNDLTNHASAKGGAAVGVVDAVTENKLTVNNTVDVKGGAALNNEKTASTEDIILSAYDEQKLNSHAEATVGGVAGVMVSKNLNTMNRTSNVNVAGTIESGSKVGLYAGANEGGALSNLNVDLKAGAYNHTAIPVSSPTVNYNSVADKGMVNVSGTVRSTGDINVIASGGREKIAKDESLFNWVKGGSSTDKKFLSSDAVVAEEAMPKTSKVTVTGSLIAGTADPINLTIGGSVANGLTITAPNNNANNRVKNGVTQGTFDYANTLGARLQKLNELIAAYDGNNSANGGTEVMAAYIAERTRIQEDMQRLGLAEKDTDGNWVYSNSGRPVYYVEIPDIATSGGNINVTANDFVGTGNLRANSAPGVTITNQSDAYLRLNNIIMGEKGGQITYNGIDNVIPPNVSQGNAKINSINVSKSGAAFREIYGVTDGQAANLSVQNTFSGDLKSTIPVTEAMKQQMRQEVQNDTSLSEANKTQLLNGINSFNSFDYIAIPDVEVNGKISNFHGNVTINNVKGDIRISGGTQARPTGVFGNTVRLTAGNGTIAQDYKEGIVNINGDPEKYLDSYTSYTDNSLITNAEQNMDFETVNLWAGGPWVRVRKAGTNKSGNAKTTYTRPDSANTATGYIAGRDVYVSASNVNVNGLIQSGYKNYTATVTDAQLNAAKGRPAGRAAVVQNRTMYKVNDGGAKWSTTDNAFYYEAQVYWDPSTNQLFVEDIDTAGGKVYLTGKIAGTGDGRILAADGAALITVTNETALDMNVGKVLNNQREGVITIADTAKDTWTEYKKGQTRTINDYAAYLKAHANDGDPYAGALVTTNTLSVTQSLTYTPKENQTYNWTKGKTVESVKEYEHFKRYGLWGAVKTQDVNSMKSEAKVIREVQGKEYGLPEGAVIQQGSNTGLTGNDLRLDTTSNRLDHYTTTPVTTLKKTGFFGWFRNYYTRWEEGEKVLKTYNYSISASQPITIGLIGAEVGKIDIKSTNNAGGSINLTGNVANSHNEATLTVSSKAGGITQFDNTLLKSEIVNLTAKEDIKNIHLASIGKIAGQDAEGKNILTDNIKLTAVSNNKGDIDITAVGGLLANQSLPGNVEIVELKSKSGNTAFAANAALGDVTLNAAGNITQSGTGTTVEGRGITLTSVNGGIGTNTQAIQIAGSDLVYSTDRYGAQVNAGAKGDIYLTEVAAGGDMRVGKIESREGNVKLEVKDGSFIDGLPGNDKSGSTDSVDEMVHRWIDAGLIDGEKDAQGNYTYKGAYIEGLEKAEADYKANVVAAYDTENGTGKTQAEWLAEYNAQKPAIENIYASADYQNYKNNTGVYAGLTAEQKAAKLAAEGHQDYITYAKYENAEACLKDTAAYKYSQYANADAYLANDTTYTTLKAKADNPTSTFEWTKDMMLYAVSDAIVNPAGGGSTQTDGPANVLGNNVTLVSSHTVGTVSDETKTITVDELSNADTRIAKMKELMNVGAADVTVKRDENGNLTEFVIKGNMPLGVKASGTLDVQAGGNVSVAGRTDTAGEHSAINVGNINATAAGDVRLYSAEGVTNALADDAADKTNITGKNLIVTGGKESIGAADKPLTVSLSGDLTEARADKNVFIQNMNDSNYLRLGAMFAKDTISLSSEKGFLMSSANANIADSYINAGKKLEFNTNETTGVVGKSDSVIRILNDRAPVNIAAKSAYIKGVNNTDVQNGTLVLGTVSTKDEFVAESAGSIDVGREEEKNSAGTVVKEAVAGNITAGGNATLTAADNLTLDGAVTADNKTVNLTATNGSITQTDKGAITADAVNTASAKSLILENEGNKFNSITVDSGSTADIAGDVRIVDNSDALTVTINQSVAGDAAKKLAGDISVQNLKANGALTSSGNLTAAGNIDLTAKGDLTQAANTTLTAGKDASLTSANGSITVENIAATAGNIDLNAGGNLTQAANTTLTAGKDVNATSTEGSMTINGAVSATDGNITLQSKAALQTTGTLTAGKDVNAASTDGATTINGDISATNGNITLQSKEALQTTGTLTAGRDVNAASTDGAMTIGGNVSATNGNISLNAKNDLTQAANTTLAVSEGKEVTLTSTAGAVKQDATSGTTGIHTKSVTVTAATGADLQGTGNAFDAITVKSAAENTPIAGSVSVKDSADKLELDIQPVVKGNIMAENTKADGVLQVVSALDADGNEAGAKGDITLKSGGSMQTDKKITAANDVKITSTSGAMTIGGDVSASNNVELTSDGNMQTNSKLTAGNDVKLTATNGDVTIKGDISTGTTPPAVAESPNFTLEGDYNSLVIRAGGAITEDAGVTIATPVVETYSGKGVSMESEKNDFDYFMADASSGDTIDGSVKVKTDSSDEEDGFFTAALGASVRGDAEFTNLAQDGSLGIVATGNAANIDVQGGNGADGNLVLTAKQDVGMLGNASAAKDIVIESENGMFFGLAKGMTAGNDVKVSAGDAVNYVGTINADHDLHIRVTNPNPESDASVIHIGALGLDDGTLLAAGNEARFEVQGDGNVELNGAVVAEAGDVAANISGAGSVLISEIVESRNGSVSVETGKGNIVIGTEALDEETVTANKDVAVKTGEGTITILGTTTATTGDVTMTAGQEEYKDGTNHGNFIIANGGELVAEQGGITLNGRNGDVVITDDIQAGKSLTVNIQGQGNLSFGNDLTVTNDVNIATEKGKIEVGNKVTSTGGNVNMTTGEGNIDVVKAVTAAQDLEITTGKGDILIGNNGPEDPTVSAKQNATVGTELGIVTIYGKTEAQQGDVTLYAGSEEYTQAGKTVVINEDGTVAEGGDGHTIVIDQNGVVKAGRDVNLGALNDDILVTDKIQAGRDVTTAVTGKGRIFFPGQVVDAREEINIALENGDFILNRGNGTRVSVWLENNSELSYLGEILADANGTAAPDVSLTGNYITVGSITKKNGGSTFQFSAIGANGQKYISQEITVDSLRSDTGTQMPSLWSNRGYVHIDEGHFKVNDLLAGDKIHLENDQTTVAVYGRTPTKDGEQLVYWNNVGMANSKRRGFDLYTDGKIGTYKAVLIDSGKYYYKLTGDNLSVVDMMRDRVTHERGEYTFDSTQLTEPGRILREPMFFGVESTDVIIRQESASDEEIVVES